MDPVDYSLRTFSLRWLSYGGAPFEDVFIDFGLDGQDYLRRFASSSAIIDPASIPMSPLNCC